MKKETISLDQCHKEYTDWFIYWRKFAIDNPNNLEYVRNMHKYSALLDLVVKLKAVYNRQRRITDEPRGDD